MLTPGALPPLDAGERERSAELAARIRARIAASGGWLPFSGFMEAALYEPGLGYYMAGGPQFGPAGDFVTAPELSPLFAACVADAVQPLLAAAGDGEIVEFGAGSGRLAAVLVRAVCIRLGTAPDTAELGAAAFLTYPGALWVLQHAWTEPLTICLWLGALWAQLANRRGWATAMCICRPSREIASCPWL